VTRKVKRLRRGLLITFEGIDGCGKTTQLLKTYRHLVDQGYKVAKLREPGTTPTAEKIRRILLHKNSSMSDLTELLLYEAARSDITGRKIVPLLKSGHIVLCDRFYDSTTAYQGYGRGLDASMVKRLHRVAVGNLRPDLTLLFDIDLRTAESRLGRRLDRLESQSRAFFNRVRKGFLEIAASEKGRVKVIDGTRPAAEVFREVKRLVQRKLSRL
jgi:dTMP kinase